MAKVCKYHIQGLENGTFCPVCMRNLRENEILELKTSNPCSNECNTTAKPQKLQQTHVSQPHNTQKAYTSSSNSTSNSSNYSTNTTSNESAKKPGCLTWIIVILLLGSLLNMCDGRSESEKWEDSFKGAYREYAKFHGYD